MSETIEQSQSENYSKYVGTSAVVLVKGGGNDQSGSGIVTVGGTINVPRSVVVHNAHASQVLYVGWGSDVTSSSGFPIAAGGYMEFELLFMDELWAVGSGADTDARVYVLHGKGEVFSPLELSPVLWLDASDTSTITESGGAVSTWADKSGNGNDVTQATEANKPTTGTRTLNSLNVIDFDGTNDLLSMAGFTTTSPYTVIAVFDSDVTLGTQYLVASDGTDVAGYLGNDAIFLLNNGSTISGASVGTFGEELVLWESDGSGSQIRRNGSVYGSGTVGTLGMSEINIGNRDDAARAFNGGIAEVIVVDGTLTAGQIAATETYLANKWGITI